MKMLLDTNLLDGGVSFIETCLHTWLVCIDGDTRTITQEGPGRFIAWIGSQDVHWCFDHALKACAEDARYQRSRTVTLPVPLSDDERWLLQFSDADNASERRARP